LFPDRSGSGFFAGGYEKFGCKSEICSQYGEAIEFYARGCLLPVRGTDD